MRGSITPHKGQPDTWRLRVYLGHDPATGQKRYRSQVFHGPRRQAEKVLNAMIAAVAQEVITTSSVTVAQLMDEWLRFCETKGLAARTVFDYRWHAEHRIIPALGTISIERMATAIPVRKGGVKVACCKDSVSR